MQSFPRKPIGLLRLVHLGIEEDKLDIYFVFEYRHLEAHYQAMASATGGGGGAGPDPNNINSPSPKRRRKSDGPVNAFSFLNAIRKHTEPEYIEQIRLAVGNKEEITYDRADALKFAIMYDHSAYTDYLLSRHLEDALVPDVCCPLMLVSARLDRGEIAEQLCHHSRRKKNIQNYINARGCSAMECRRTALHIASETGNIEILDILLKYGANSSLQDDTGSTPLDRILSKLQPPHLSWRTLQCAIRLILCEHSLQPNTCSDFNRLVDRDPSWRGKLDQAWQDVTPGPFSLTHQCKVKIRQIVGYPRLPEGLTNLGLPQPLENILSKTT